MLRILLTNIMYMMRQLWQEPWIYLVFGFILFGLLYILRRYELARLKMKNEMRKPKFSSFSDIDLAVNNVIKEFDNQIKNNIIDETTIILNNKDDISTQTDTVGLFFQPSTSSNTILQSEHKNKTITNDSSFQLPFHNDHIAEEKLITFINDIYIGHWGVLKSSLSKVRKKVKWKLKIYHRKGNIKYKQYTKYDTRFRNLDNEIKSDKIVNIGTHRSNKPLNIKNLFSMCPQQWHYITSGNFYCDNLDIAFFDSQHQELMEATLRNETTASITSNDTPDSRLQETGTSTMSLMRV